MRLTDLAAVAVAGLAVAGFALMPGTAEPEGPAARPQASRTVDRAQLVCPPLPAPDDASARTTVVVPPLTAVPAAPSPEPDSEPPVRAGIVQVRGPETTLARLTQRGDTWRTDRDAVIGGFTADVTGSLAAGLSATTSSAYDTPRVRGLAVSACALPRSEWWFVGAGSSVGRAGSLVIANPTDGVAQADITLYGPDGVLDQAAVDPVALEPGGRKAIALEDVAPGVEDLAIRVRTTQGQVAAFVYDSYRDGRETAGVDYLGSAAEPARTTALTGLTGGDGSRVLSVVNTGDSETVVTLEVLGRSGAFEPTDTDVLRVPAGAVVRRDVTAITKQHPSGLRLRADQPISAAVRSTSSGPTDVAYTASAVPLESASALALPGNRRGTVIVSGLLREPTSGRLTAYDSEGRPVAEQDVRLDGGQTATWQVPQDKDAAVVVLAVDKGRLAAAIAWSGGGTSVTPMMPLRVTTEPPAVERDFAGH